MINLTLLASIVLRIDEYGVVSGFTGKSFVNCENYICAIGIRLPDDSTYHHIVETSNMWARTG